ncbi:MAG: hypothetical protein ABR980_07745 [Ignavibacteriaceae bacterium]|jgi:hypothetical protein
MGRKKNKEPEYKSPKSKKRALRKKNPFYQTLSINNKLSYSRHYNNIDTTLPRIIVAPKNFSFTDLKYIESTLRFFEKLDFGVLNNGNIFLNMENITYITEDAILYLLSRLYYYRFRFPSYRVSGNFPTDQICEKLLLDSNFTKYVQTAKKHNINEKEIFPIRDGIDANGEIIGEVLTFIESKISLPEDSSFDIYGPMLECLTNSKNHAYQNPNLIQNKWWLIAIPDKNLQNVHYTCLDNGRGIPTTIHKNFTEKIKLLSSSRDHDLIISALKGEFRTRTGKEERGKGLPSVFESTSNMHINNLTIISNFAYVKISRNKEILAKVQINKKFRGTLLSWDFIK